VRMRDQPLYANAGSSLFSRAQSRVSRSRPWALRHGGRKGLRIARAPVVRRKSQVEIDLQELQNQADTKHQQAFRGCLASP